MSCEHLFERVLLKAEEVVIPSYANFGTKNATSDQHIIEEGIMALLQQIVPDLICQQSSTEKV